MRMTRLASLTTSLLALTALLAAAPPADAAPDATVLMVPGSFALGQNEIAGNVAFVPAVTVAGDDLDGAAPTASFANTDAVRHHPRADTGCFDAGQLPAVVGRAVVSLAGCAGESVGYFCAIHPKMQGTILLV